MSNFEHELAVALDAAERGGAIGMRYFGKSPGARQKGDGSWVTEADWAVEAHVRLLLARAFPDHNILGEEEGLSKAGGGPPERDAPTWVVDPIDGTNNYMSGIPVWATLVALRSGGRTRVGVCHAPALSETYEAADGGGARCNERPIEVRPVARLEEATVFLPGPESFRAEGMEHMHDSLTRRCWRSRGFADFWGHMLVARGAGAVAVDPAMNLWDVAALEPIVLEAGGTITGLDGAPWRLGGCVTTCGPLKDDVLALTVDPSATA